MHIPWLFHMIPLPLQTSLIVQASNTSESLGILPVVDCYYYVKVKELELPSNAVATSSCEECTILAIKLKVLRPSLLHAVYSESENNT